MGKKKLLALLMATVLAMQPTISVTAETGQVTDSVGDYEGEETKEKSKVTELENTDSAVPNSPAVDEEMTKMTSNRVFIQSNDLDRFDSYSTIVSRINYSIICSFSAFICFIESYSINLKRMDNPFFSQGIMWITVLIGTWISFEGLSEPRKNETEKINKDKNILPKDIIEYAISLFVGPITLIIVIVISYFWKLNIKQLPKCIYIIAFSFAISVIIMGLIINKIRNRSSESYKTRIYKKIITLKEGEKMNIFYSNLYLNIEKEGQKIKLKILEQNIEIDKKNEISKKGRKQLEEWFSMSYVFTYDLSRQGYNEMIQKLDEHSNNRKDALNKCYNQIRTNYFKKHKNCYCS